ncbi:FRG domain-containing protein [Schinkia azotoformans]|uniref:FRG domain-containing protein n=1 Tax=Schinkia azotoformans LMG 9581 TaxID=1131731 RepID=K6DJ75_SCHAZ|nr:FRG domain-containing protein [Schinkia azotoformans]EKN68369.1 FRG domain-containing protein [Schinkia azotoformans LMG 9581]MEC1638518.1 FRG domain-containing protein [Schinkia azotoformans]MEC1946048.1 FRG domain-containing protein [Schinkia azotoformans]
MKNALDITNYFFSENWLKLLEEVTFFAKKSRLVWYRGQSNNASENGCYPLLSGLFRQSFSVEKILQWEELSYKRFFENGFDLHKTENQWDLLYLMQQYGVKTRLLDWSESFAVALYFATRNWDHKTSCSIWLLDPFRLNRIFHNLDELTSMPKTIDFLEARKEFQKTMALSPRMNTYRSMFQKGYFTLQGNTKQGLEEEENGVLLRERILKHIKIDVELRNDVELFLELSGINQLTLFPDLGGLASYVNQWTTTDLMKQKFLKDTNDQNSKLFRQTSSGKIEWKEDENTFLP